MSASRFIDTNILLYAYDLDAPDKRAAALTLVKQGWSALGDTAISVQVLQEMYVNLARRGVSQVETAQIVRDFFAWPIVENTRDLLEAAINEQRRWQLSLWDALILAAVRVSGATELMSEDFNHGQDYGGIRAVNPFL